jgi:hypothetical protein
LSARWRGAFARDLERREAEVIEVELLVEILVEEGLPGGLCESSRTAARWVLMEASAPA